MSDMAKQARAAMKAKASKLTSADPHQKVDSSTWTPPEALNTEVKTGMRPVSRRAFKKGGKVMGEKAACNLGRKPRKSGGKAITADSLINRNVKEANEDRAGIKHIGGMKKGGAAKRKGKAGGGYSASSDFHDENAVPNPKRPPDSAKKPEDAEISPAMANRMRGIMDSDAAANRAYEQNKIDREAFDVRGYKSGGKAKKAMGGPMAGSQKMMLDAQNVAGVPASVLNSAPAPSRFSKQMGMKKGGTAKHDDAKQDMALIKKMVKPEARTARKEGGGVFSGPGYPGKVPGVTGGRIARATGGKTKGKTNINILISAGQKQPGQDMMGPPPGMGKPPGGLPIPVPPAAGGPPMPMPVGAPAPMPAPMPMPAPRKSGGRLTKVASSYKDMEAGAAGGEGRLQKTDIAKKHKDAPAFKKGGKVYRSYKDMDAGSGSGFGRLEKAEIQKNKH